MPLISKAFSDLITFSRASSATYFAANGVLTTAANNEPRFDYDPATFLPRGLLIEEARTNSIRNNTMQGASAGVAPTNWLSWNVTTNGVTIASSAAGTENGIAYIDVTVSGTCTLTGTAHTPSFEPATQVAATVGQTWTESVYWTLVSGSLGDSSFNVRLTEADSGGLSLTSGDSATVVPAVGNLRSARYTFTRTLTNASTAFLIPRLRFGFVNGSTYNFTLRIGLPQLELGAFATSVIPTTTTALTRSADVASVNTLSPWLNQAEGTLFAEFTARLGVTQTPATFSGVGGIGYRVRKSSTNQYYAALRDGGSVKDIAITPSPALTEGQVIKVAVGVKLNDCALSGGGQTAVTQPAFSPMPTITDVNLGFTGTDGFALNGWFRRFTYYPSRLSNADLATITT